MECCDVLIVGGGPAGSTCARRLAGQGMDVLVRDRALFPRHKPCAGWLTPPVLAAIDFDAAEYAAGGRTLQPFTGFRVGTIGGGSVLADYGRPVSFGILRREFDHFLLERSGARFRGGTPVTRLERSAGAWVADGELRAPMVVGSGGHFCPVARALDAGPPPAAPVVAQEVEFPLDARDRAACRVQPEVPELYFCRDLRGYGWCVRKGDHLNVGLGRRDGRRFPGHVASFVEFVQRAGRIPGALPSRWHGHAYFLDGDSGRRVVGDGALLAGDSAGLAAAASGEGIRTAVLSGLLAAEAILAAAGRYSAADLAPYADRLRRRLGPLARRAPLPPALARALSAVLLRSGWFIRNVVLDRWFLGLEPAAPRGTAGGTVGPGARP